MAVTGHKTRAVFDRYHIASPADPQEVARKLTGAFSGILRLTPMKQGCNLPSNFNRLIVCARSSAWIERRPAEPKVTRSNRVGHAIYQEGHSRRLEPSDVGPA